MANREIIISLIKKSSDKLLNDEISYYMDVEHEYKYDEADALSDVYDFAEDNNERKLIKVIRLIFIEAGYLKERTEHHQFLGRDCGVTVNKIKYDFESGWVCWIAE